jgi:hypothetical protein
MLGLFLILMSLAVVILVSKAISMRLVPNSFCTLCATAFMILLVISFIFDRAGPGNEFGPVAEMIFFFPVGLGFWIGGLVVLWRARSWGEPLGYVRTTLQCLSGLLYIGPLLSIGWTFLFPSPIYVYNMKFEVRIPKSTQIDPLTQVSLHAMSFESRTTFGRMRQRSDGDFAVFSDLFEIEYNTMRILVVQQPKAPFQVFRLPLSKKLKVADWTEWQRPDYTENPETDNPYRDRLLLRESEKHERSAKLPADCVELRYKIEKHELEKWER